jgi:hypothetical protein
VYPAALTAAARSTSAPAAKVFMKEVAASWYEYTGTLRANCQ